MPTNGSDVGWKTFVEEQRKKVLKATARSTGITTVNDGWDFKECLKTLCKEKGNYHPVPVLQTLITPLDETAAFFAREIDEHNPDLRELSRLSPPEGLEALIWETSAVLMQV